MNKLTSIVAEALDQSSGRSTDEAWERTISEVLSNYGVVLAGRHGQRVRRNPSTCEMEMELTIAQPRVRVVIDELGGSRPEHALNALDDGVHVLFRYIIDHIAKHDRHTLDRLREVEAAAQKLVNSIIDRNGDGATRCALELDRLLRAKPGAASWRKDGFGKDPTG